MVGPSPVSQKTPRLCFVRFSYQAGCQERVSFQSSCWSDGSGFWDILTQSVNNVTFFSWCSHAQPSTQRGHQQKCPFRSVTTRCCPFCGIIFSRPTGVSFFHAEGAGHPFCFYRHRRLFSQHDELHLTVSCLSIQHHLQPAHSLYCHLLMAAL